MKEQKPTTKPLTPADVMAMPLAQFEQWFGFRPVDALEKKWFAVNARRITPDARAAIDAGILPAGDLGQVVMD